MSWRKKRVRDRRECEEERVGPHGRTPAARPELGPAGLYLLRAPLRPGMANAGRYASLLRAGQQTVGNAALRALLRGAQGVLGDGAEVASPQEEELPGESGTTEETIDVEQENQGAGWGAAGGPASDKSQPAAPAAAKAYDMGKEITNATETFYTIKEPKLEKVAKHFKFGPKGKRYAAHTSWRVEIGGWKPVKKDGELVVDPLPWKIKSITVEFPKWKNFDKASEPEKKAWADFIKGVRAHEQGHVNRVRDFMNKVPAEYKAIRGRTMKELKAEEKWARDAVLTFLREDSDKYDVKTNHGATQGAVLKPPAADKPAATK